ncbi:MAG: zf-HC2 domain-containing protein [candidate division Zixibacteria bacterium]|nr:zf-HC2 domain-containing protein [candidate division Zixibacteria bacterium]
MRCRKVRSYLSAYCGDELSGRRKLAVSEHLAACAECRRAEADYRSLIEAGSQLSTVDVSENFNAKLLNRVARERFAETRTKAYLPRKAPVVRWTTVVAPIAVTASLIFAFLMVGFQPGTDNFDPGTARNTDNSYLTAQPVKNPNMTNSSMQKDWSLTSQMARADRLDRMSQRIVERIRANSIPSTTGLTNVSATANQPAPWNQTFYRIRPVVRIYQTPDVQKGGNTAY